LIISFNIHLRRCCLLLFIMKTSASKPFYFCYKFLFFCEYLLGFLLSFYLFFICKYTVLGLYLHITVSIMIVYMSIVVFYEAFLALLNGYFRYVSWLYWRFWINLTYLWDEKVIFYHYFQIGLFVLIIIGIILAFLWLYLQMKS
jgi:hypothetical protein